MEPKLAPVDTEPKTRTLDADEAAVYAEFQEATRLLAKAELAQKAAAERYERARTAMHQFALRGEMT